jgi:hypothetical protein
MFFTKLFSEFIVPEMLPGTYLKNTFIFPAVNFFQFSIFTCYLKSGWNEVTIGECFGAFQQSLIPMLSFQWTLVWSTDLNWKTS